LAAEGRVRPVVVVVVEEVRERGAAFTLGRVVADVGPFPGQRPVIAFDLPIRPRGVGAGALVLRADRGERVCPGRRAVAGAVVGQYAADHRAVVGGEEADGAVPEGDRGDGLLVLQGRGVGEPGVVVEGGVKVGVADLPSAGAGAFGGAGGIGAHPVHAPAA